MSGRSVLGLFKEVDEAVEAADKLKENGIPQVLPLMKITIEI